MVEIAKSNWAVVKACLKADLDIAPALVKVKTACESDLAKVTFANSITLTPVHGDGRDRGRQDAGPCAVRTVGAA